MTAAGGPVESPSLPRVSAVIVGAMPSEVAPFEVRCSELGDELRVGHARLRHAVLRGRRVLVVRSGIGLVNAAAATTSALHLVRTPIVISVGSAGGFEGRVAIGQVAVGTEHRYHNADATAFGYALGQVPGMPASFPVEQDALSRIAHRPEVIMGPHVSGDTFVDGPRIGRLLTDFPDAVATEMEATAIAQVAHSFGVGFISVRGISDLCGVDAAADHSATVDAVSDASAEVVVAMLS